MYINLAPFLNPSPYIVSEDTSLAKAYNLFRQLGLRHLLVIPLPSCVLGVITGQGLLINDGEDVTAVELPTIVWSLANMLLSFYIVLTIHYAKPIVNLSSSVWFMSISNVILY